MDYFEEKLYKIKENDCFRSIKNITAKDEKFVFLNGKKLLNLSSNNYLGVADNQKNLKEFLKSQDELYSLGSASARLLSANLPVYDELERTVAGLYNKQKALLFNTGYQANLGLISALSNSDTMFLADKLVHASMLDGLKLNKANFARYNHLDYEQLEELLKKYSPKYKNIYIVSESVFSMDGDIADLKKLCELKEKYSAKIILDEAHAFGVFGPNALGIAEQDGLIDKIDIIIATFGKAIGSMGAFIVSDTAIIDYLINTARSFIFSTALPPMNIAFSLWVIKNILPNTLEQRTAMLQNADRLRDNLINNGFNTLGSSQIVPVILGKSSLALETAEYLQTKGFFVLPVRPPSVKENSSRLRISLTTQVNENDIVELSEILIYS
ncbi:MAG: 8-amino-7-oxononanoate synthase [Candidatus Gastranaerophilales bacterium]|nr:8-amino-7-oxononanoate synthase [Candidatus Gastranaerophilales bacterium]